MNHLHRRDANEPPGQRLDAATWIGTVAATGQNPL
jgi:hypothetical protein